MGGGIKSIGKVLSSAGAPVMKSSGAADPTGLVNKFSGSVNGLLTGQGAQQPGSQSDPMAKGYTDANGNYVSGIEAESGIRMPGYEGTRDAQGNLKANFKFDPYAGAETQKLKAEADSTSPSPWAQMQLQNQGIEQQNAKDAAMKSGQQALSMGNANMMRFGGQSNGARERMGSQSLRDILSAKQDVSRQGIEQRGAINSQDLQRKQDLTGQLAAQEGQAQAANIGTMSTDVNNLAQFNANKYAQQMQAYGASKSANAQAKAANSGGKK